MKIILSRKGFDTTKGNGEIPSPIFPNDTMLSLPIPAKPEDGSTVMYKDLLYNGTDDLAGLLRDLKAKVEHNAPVHLDPDISGISVKDRPKKDGWRPLFGQHHIAESHLRGQCVGKGDVFLFYGLFRRATDQSGKWEYERRSKRMHVIFGWMQIGERTAALDWPSARAWALDHPHLRPEFVKNNDSRRNALYVAAERLSSAGLQVAGAGTFQTYSEKLRLTKEDSDQHSKWSLPSWFFHTNPLYRLTYHDEEKRSKRWHESSFGRVDLDSVGRGQEFVLDCDHYPEAIPWLTELFEGTKS